MSENGDVPAEIRAMGMMANALEPLDEEARVRVLHWAAAYYAVPVARQGGGPALEAATDTSAVAGDADSLAELFARADPQTQAERVLVASYWLQMHREEDQLDALRVNSELKHLGYQITNITREFDRLKAARPQLIVQTRKGGKTKQARKKYRLSAAGQHQVQQMLNAAG